MKTMKKTAACLLLALSVAACGDKSGTASSQSASAQSASTPPSSTASAKESAKASTGEPAKAPAAGGGGMAGPATVDGAKAVIAELQKDKANIDKVTPSADDVKAIFSDAGDAEKVATHVQEMLSKHKEELPKGDSEVFCASSEDVKAWKPEVEKEFPGGYKRVGPKLNGGLTLCKFKIGSVSFDALINVGGKWFFVPKAFRALRGERGGSHE